MFGKIFRLLAVFILAILISGTAAFAAAPEVAYEKDAVSTADETEHIFDLGKPAEDEVVSTYDTYYTFSGSGEPGAEVHIMVFDEELDRYRDLELIIDDTDPENPEKITSFVVEGLFSWDIDLPYMGINKIRLVGVKDDKYKIVDREITVLDPSTKEEIINFLPNPFELIQKTEEFFKSLLNMGQ